PGLRPAKSCKRPAWTGPAGRLGVGGRRVSLVLLPTLGGRLRVFRRRGSHHRGGGGGRSGRGCGGRRGGVWLLACRARGAGCGRRGGGGRSRGWPGRRPRRLGSLVRGAS